MRAILDRWPGYALADEMLAKAGRGTEEGGNIKALLDRVRELEAKVRELKQLGDCPHCGQHCDLLPGKTKKEI